MPCNRGEGLSIYTIYLSLSKLSSELKTTMAKRHPKAKKPKGKKKEKKKETKSEELRNG